VVFGEQQVGEVVQCGDDRRFVNECNGASGERRRAAGGAER
jgi:hypothetical protein